jgi:hypothetical protein
MSPLFSVSLRLVRGLVLLVLLLLTTLLSPEAVPVVETLLEQVEQVDSELVLD